MKWLRNPWINIALCLVTLLAGLVICELVARNFVSVHNVGPSFSTYDPYYGKVLKKTFSCRRVTPEFSIAFTTNSEGFRGSELGSLSPRPILFMGDSFTMGYGVNDGEEFPALVQKALNADHPEAITVINAGMGDNGNGRWVKFLRRDAQKFDPGLIVFQMHDNDFYDNRSERLFTLSSAGELCELPVPGKETIRKIQQVIDSIPCLANSHFVGLFRQVQWSLLYAPDDTQIKTPVAAANRDLLEKRLTIRLLEQVVTICKKEIWPLLFLLADLSGPHLAVMEQFLRSHNIPTIVIPSRQERPDLYYKIDIHWNLSGNKFAADQVMEGIRLFGLRYW